MYTHHILFLFTIILSCNASTNSTDDYCEQFKSCGHCSAETECGWCVDPIIGQVCVSGTENGPDSHMKCYNWNYKSFECLSIFSIFNLLVEYIIYEN